MNTSIALIKIAFYFFVGSTPVTADTYIDTQHNGSVTYVRNNDGEVIADVYTKDGAIIHAGTLRMEQEASNNEQQQ